MSQPSHQSGVTAVTPPPAVMPYVRHRPMVPGRQPIALIAVHSDPTAKSCPEDMIGQDVYVLKMSEALAKLGWQVDIFTRKTDSAQDSIVQYAEHCRVIRLTAGPESYIHRDELFPHLPDFVEAFQAFQAKAGAHYPLIHTNYWLSGWVGLQLKQVSNVQLIHTHHSLGAVKYRSGRERSPIVPTRLATEQQLTEQADRITTTSPQDMELLRSLVSFRQDIDVIPGGADVDTFHQIPQAEARSTLGFSPSDQIVLYVGHFDSRKGLETLIHACQNVQVRQQGTLRLVIAGGNDAPVDKGEEQRRIETLVNDLGLADYTQFVGRIAHQTLPLYYTAANVCVIPSQYEPFGLVAIEAMACGTPVVASDIGGLKFAVVPEETGLLVPVGDVEGFTAAIDRVLAADELWTKRISVQASERVQQNFSWASAAATLSHLYRHLLAQSISQSGLLAV